MPAKKKLRSAGASQPKTTAAKPLPTAVDEDVEFAQLAKQHWLKTTKRSTKVKVKNEVLKTEIWDSLEKDGFQFKSLAALESFQLLER